MATDNETKKDEAKEAIPKFTKEQLVESARFADDRDLVMALLDERTYTISEVEKKIQQYKKGKVK